MNKFVDIILVNKNQEILLLKRGQYDDLFPGKWGLPGGHAEENSDAGVNARRECYEETNIVCTNTYKLFDYKFNNKASTTIFIAYEGKDFSLKNRAIKLCSREHSEYKWVMLEEALEMDLMDDLGNILIKTFG